MESQVQDQELFLVDKHQLTSLLRESENLDIGLSVTGKRLIRYQEPFQFTIKGFPEQSYHPGIIRTPRKDVFMFDLSLINPVSVELGYEEVNGVLLVIPSDQGIILRQYTLRGDASFPSKRRIVHSQRTIQPAYTCQ